MSERQATSNRARMNKATNNANLVLAFELSKGGKVLLFVGDAQAGNWWSWSEKHGCCRWYGQHMRAEVI